MTRRGAGVVGKRLLRPLLLRLHPAVQPQTAGGLWLGMCQLAQRQARQLHKRHPPCQALGQCLHHLPLLRSRQ